MKFDATQHVWVCAAHDEASHALTYCLVERTSDITGTITAADGYCMAQITCTLEQSEEVGLVHYTALEQAAKQAKSKAWRHAHNGELFLELRGDQVALLGMTVPRWIYGQDDAQITFPDVTKLVTVEYLMKSHRLAKPYAFYPKRACQVAEALGREYLSLWCAEDADLYVDVRYRHMDGSPKAPYGALMGANVK